MLLCLFRSNSDILSKSFGFVKYFFHLFSIPSPDRLDDSLTACISQARCFCIFWRTSVFYRICHLLSSTFFKKFVERRKRDLNPRAAVNDLLPFQGSPFGQLGYFSIVARIAFYIILSHDILMWWTERVGFEPTRPCGQTVFKTASLWPLRYPCVSQLILNCLVVCTCSAQNLYYHQCYNMSTLISIFFTLLTWKSKFQCRSKFHTHLKVLDFLRVL